MIPYKPPKFKEKAFNCPHCNAYSNQIWLSIYFQEPGISGSYYFADLSKSRCAHCQKYSLWVKGELIYPDISGVPLPNQDLNEEIKQDYLEASSIVNKSPRGATALLRLCIQKLCAQLGESGDLNPAIANLVKKGLPPKIQQSLDIVRVIGNHAVHPGRIDLKDNRETAMKLFELISLIADVMITQPKQIEALYSSLPETDKKQIDKRDSK